MKLSGSILSIISVLLLSMLVASATSSEMSGGMDVVADNGGYISGVSGPGSYSVMLGDSAFTRDINAGEEQTFDALFDNDAASLGTVSVRYDNAGLGDPSSWAPLPFVAPDNLMNILLIQSTRPSSITSGQFTTSVLNAGKTWNDGSINRDFFGSVSDAPRSTSAQRNDGKFVQSFTRSSQSWLACCWVTWNANTLKLKDWDVKYNTRYTYSTDKTKTQNANLRYVDLQAVVLHEAGHAVGLDDIYNKADKRWDINQVMNGYIYGQPRYSLGAGDLNGLKTLYGG